MEVLLYVEVAEFILQHRFVILVEAICEAIVLHVMAQSRDQKGHPVKAIVPCNLVNALAVDHVTHVMGHVDSVEIVMVLNVSLVPVVNQRDESDKLLGMHLAVAFVYLH